MKLRSLSSLLLSTIALSSLSPTRADAGEPDFLSAPFGSAPASSDDWQFFINPYTWLAGLDGTVGIGQAVTDVDLSFGDIFENLDFAAMLALEARKGKWAFQLDGFWISLSADADTPGPLFGDAKVEVDEFRVAPMLSYRVVEGQTNVDVLAGAQYFRVETDLKLNAGALAARTVSDTEEWVDPMVGVRLNHQFSEKWFAFARVDVGGFGVNSDFIWQAFGAIGYRWRPNSTFLFGYRHLNIDYSSSGFTYDAATSGFILGSRWHF